MRLNLGYAFNETEVSDFDREADQHLGKGIAIGKGSSKNYGVGVRQHLAGVSVSKSENEVDYSLQDFNGDGLLDACY